MTRTVRLDPATESTLADVCKKTGLSMSEVIRRGIRAYAASIEEASVDPYEVFRRLDLGPGGYAIAPAREAKSAIAKAIREKHNR